MKNYYISDMHFGHANILKHSHRPFATAAEMDEAMIRNWNNIVTNQDTVYILGDICMGNDEMVVSYLKQLAGNKVLIAGNHDRNLDDFQNSKLAKYITKAAYYMEIKDTLNGRIQKVVLSHYPMAEWNGFYHGAIHLYGHVHNNVGNDAYKIMAKIPNAYNVGVDILDFTPRTLDEVIRYNQTFLKAHPVE